MCTHYENQIHKTAINKGDPQILHDPKRITKVIEGNGREYGDFPLFIKDSEGFGEI